MAGNARFHNKWHRRNHHSSPSINYPDSATDPIASADEPFQGEMVINGYLSAHGNAFIDGDTTIQGNLSVYGDLSYFDTYVSVTSSLSVVNMGPGPAVVVEQYGNEPIARFLDPTNTSGGTRYAFSIENDGYVVVNGTTPKIKFDQQSQSQQKQLMTVNGNIYSERSVIWETPMANTVYVSTTGSDTNSGLNPSQKVRTIKKAAKVVFDTYGPNKATILVEAGDYTENNPIYIPAGTSMIGEGYLRRVNIRPYNRQLDVLWLNNGCYIWGFTFRDHLDPSSATAFPNLLSGTPAYNVAFQTPGYEIDVTRPGGPFGFPIVSKPYITTSPYTQGCSSINRFLYVPIQPNLYNSGFVSGTQQFNYTLTNGESTSAYILSSFNNITKIIKNGPSVAPVQWNFTPATGASDAVSLINLNKTAIQQGTVNYVNDKYPTFIYDQTKCYRDVGYILDAINYDLTNGTNLSSVSAGLYYFSGNTSLISGQESQTIDAINYTNFLVNYVIANSAVPIYQQQFYPTYTLAPSVSSYVTLCTNTINTIIRNGVGTLPAPVYWAVDATAASQASYLLNLNRPYIGKTVINYIDKNFPGFAYNRTLCERDTGYIIDAITNDITNGNTLSSIYAGTKYYSGGLSLIRGQEIPTIAAIRYINYLAQNILTNTIAVTSQSFNPYLSSGKYSIGDIDRSIDTLNRIIMTQEVPTPTYDMDQYINPIYTNGGNTSAFLLSTFSTIVNIISSGVGGAPAIVPTPAPAGSSAAINLLTYNRTFIQEQTIKYITQQFPTLRYNKSKCFRDAGYMVDAAISDLTNSTNASAVNTGLFYWNGNKSRIKGQQFQTISSIEYINSLAQDVVTNTLIDTKSNAVWLLSANRTFIQKEVIQYMDKAYPTFVYNKEKCERDVGYIVDAVIYDITNSTNASAIDAGTFYVGGAIAGQEIQTVAAINYARYLMKYIVQNVPVKNIDAGCGIRVDGELALGFLRSFVTDSFTQFNQGGKGIHVINCGYAQLVSTFTICTTEGVLCETGGNCSISTSNCSFGLSGIVATGKSKFPVLTGYQYQTTPLADNFLVVQDVTPRPLSAFVQALQAGNELEGIPVEEPYNGLLVNVQDDPASDFDVLLNPTGATKYHGIKAVSALQAPYPPFTYRLTLERNVQAPLTASNIDPKYVEFYLRSQIASSSHAFEYIGTGIELEKSVPALGGKVNNNNEAVYSDNGIVYYSSTNERGDFKVGGGFTIKQEKGTVEGVDFNKSILALVTPLILSLDS